DQGSISFAVDGSGFDALDATTVWVHAIETQNGAAAGDEPLSVEPSYVLASGYAVVVQQHTTIASGAFSVSCDHALGQSGHYPGFAMLSDTNHNGFCAADDQVITSAAFAWTSETMSVGGAFTSPDLQRAGDWHGAVGPSADVNDVCPRYGFPAKP